MENIKKLSALSYEQIKQIALERADDYHLNTKQKEWAVVHFVNGYNTALSEVDAARDNGIDKCIRHCREHGYFKVADSLEHLKGKK